MKPFVDFSTYNSSNPFGAMDLKYYPTTHHHIGSDFKVPMGTPIVAPADGELVKAFYNHARGNTAIFIFKHGIEWGLEFCHLKELPFLGKFKQGQVLATSGNTGSATSGAHLHVTLHKDGKVTKNYNDLTSEAKYFELVKEGRIVDPYKWFMEHSG